jgi:hypothetical protein
MLEGRGRLNDTEMWRVEDQMKALDQGWSIEPVGDDRYALTWTDPFRLDKTWDDNPEKFIAEQAAAGVPLYERAWVFIVSLTLQGRWFNLVSVFPNNWDGDVSE